MTTIKEDKPMLQMKHRISKENAAMLIKKLEASRFGESTKMTVEEAMKLSPISKAPVSWDKIFAIQFGDVNLLFWFANSTYYIEGAVLVKGYLLLLSASAGSFFIV